MAITKQRPDRPRLNREIRKSPVRLIGPAGEQVGVIPVDEALRMAEDEGLDLVEVSPDADPPVVRIMDWGKVKFEREKKAKEARRKTAVIEIKEVKFRPTIDDGDFDRKVDTARKFLEKGKKVKVTVFFRFRQLRRPDLGIGILDKVAELCADLADVESRSSLEGRRMVLVLGPRAAH